ncbi:unnamed protein product [Chrysoparadoxa australica]
MSEEETPFPLAPVLALCSAQLCYAYSTTSLLVYVGRQVVHLMHGPEANVFEFIDGVGIHVGMITSAIMVGRIISAFPWSLASQRIGRKPCLLIGVAALIVSQLMYGLSTKLWHATLCRFLQGLLSPIGMVGNMVCREIGGPEHEMRARSYFTGTWSSTMAFASALGGLMAEPVAHYPEAFGNSRLLKVFPYLLPNLFGACLGVVAFVLVLVSMPETLNRSPHGAKEDETNADGSVAQLEEESAGGEVPAFPQGGLEMPRIREEVVRRSEQSEQQPAQTDRPADSWLDVQAEVGLHAKLKSALAIDGSLAALACVVTAGFTWVLFEEAISLLMVATSDQGGFEWTPGLGGALLSLQGAVSGLWQFFVFPLFAKSAAPWLLQAILCSVAVPFIMAFPATSFAYPLGNSWLFPIASSSATACAIVIGMVYTTTWVVCMNYKPEDPGIYNGLIFTMLIAGQGSASLLSGGLTQIGLEEGLPFPLNHFLPFTAGAIAMALIACISFWYWEKERTMEQAGIITPRPSITSQGSFTSGGALTPHGSVIPYKVEWICPMSPASPGIPGPMAFT